jgi:hypothetical protein
MGMHVSDLTTKWPVWKPFASITIGYSIANRQSVAEHSQSVNGEMAITMLHRALIPGTLVNLDFIVNQERYFST